MRKSAAREYIEAFAMAIIVAMVLRASVVQANVIPSGSMEPTLLIGDHILVNKLTYGLRVPDSLFGLKFADLPWGKYIFRLESIHRGDVVVFRPPQDRIPAQERNQDWIKRVIGLPGDRIEVRNSAVWLNGKPMDDPHAHFALPPAYRSKDNPRDNYPPIIVPPGKLFMMGDNRDDSFDSRFWGFADEHDVEGRAMVISWSWRSEDRGPISIRWNRFGMVVH